jgi:uncharacterized protein DUF4157
MNAHSDKPRETRKQPVADAAARQSGSAEAPFQFAGERAEDIRIRELRALAPESPLNAQLRSIRQLVKTSPQVKQAAQLQALVARSPRVQEFAQLQALVDPFLASPANPIQRERSRRIVGFDPAATEMSPEAAERALPEIVQRKIDAGKFNVVGENHSQYTSVARETEARKVTTIFGQGAYHTEDSFSAIPNVAAEGRTEEEKDLLQTFASKADPPYYAITQGLSFIIQWCTDYKSFPADRRLLVLINAAQARIETEMEREPLKKVEGSKEESDFVLAHDSLLARFERIDDPKYPRENLVGDPYFEYGELGRPNRDLGQEVVAGVAELKSACEAYLLKIHTAYAKAKAEFEQFMGINPDDNLIKKRSVTMGFHAGIHSMLGKKGVLKVGEYHLADFAKMDLGDATLSANEELQKFLQENTPALNTGQLKSADGAGAGSAQRARSPTPTKAGSTGLPVDLKSGIEALSGQSMDGVEVHYNSARPAQLNALAFAQGTDIHVAPGQERHLPHEAWHVVQQAQGRVRPMAKTIDGVGINDDPALESEADAMGGKAMQLRRSVNDSLTEATAPSAAARRSATPGQPVQRLSDIEPADWIEQLKNREELRTFPRFPAIAVIASSENPDAEALEEAITHLGEAVLADHTDIAKVYAAIARYFPEGYLTLEDVAKVKTYNFDGPVVFTAENVMSWLRLASGEGTVDDLRYIHHEIYEIKQIEKKKGGPEIIKDKEPGESWGDFYEPAHGAALMVEIRFLTHAINLIYHKNYTWQQVAASDLERREEFLSALYGADGKETPLDKKLFPDMDQVRKDYGKFIDPELSRLLTELKNKRLGSNKD